MADSYVFLLIRRENKQYLRSLGALY